MQPTRVRGASNTLNTLLGLAPDEVCHAICVTTNAVRSYRTFSPLPFQAVCFLWHWLSVSCPGVAWHLTLRSPDFPLRDTTKRLSD